VNNEEWHDGQETEEVQAQAPQKQKDLRMTDHISAAQTLIRSLRDSSTGGPAPQIAHSVWVQTVIDPGTGHATGAQQLCVSIRPSWKSKIKVPEIHEGIPVVNVPWPKGS
jgi:hypothetical protein